MIDNGITSSFLENGGALPIDAFLLGLNVFNAFYLCAILHPVESPLKQPLAEAKLRVVSKAHATPFLVSAVLASLLTIATCSAVRYSVSVADDDSAKDTTSLLRAIVAGYTFVITCVFIKLSGYLIKLSVGRVLELDREVARHDIVRFEPPSKAVMEAVVAPQKAFLSVESTGLERIPDGVPHLFVSNHSLYGLEMPLFINHLYQNKNIFPRGLADHFHFATPNGSLLRAFGAVDGTRQNVDALMKAGNDVLVYPGGAHEVLKHSSVPRYELLWKGRVGFARCAIKHGYPIVPCACVGTEDMFDTLGDIPTGYRGMVIPIAVTTPGRVQKVYFWFGDPIDTKQYNGEFENDDFARKVRDQTKAAIEAGIRELQERQKVDPGRYLVDRIRQYWTPSSSTTDEKEATTDSDGDDSGKLKVK